MEGNYGMGWKAIWKWISSLYLPYLPLLEERDIFVKVDPFFIFKLDPIRVQQYGNDGNGYEIPYGGWMTFAVPY